MENVIDLDSKRPGASAAKNERGHNSAGDNLVSAVEVLKKRLILLFIGQFTLSLLGLGLAHYSLISEAFSLAIPYNHSFYGFLSHLSRAHFAYALTLGGSGTALGIYLSLRSFKNLYRHEIEVRIEDQELKKAS